MLCNAVMNRLITGAENSLSSSSEMFSKHTSNLTGNLTNNVMNRGGGPITMEESPCHYYQTATNAFTTGNLYLSQNFLCFESLAGCCHEVSLDKFRITT